MVVARENSREAKKMPILRTGGSVVANINFNYPFSIFEIACERFNRRVEEVAAMLVQTKQARRGV